MNEIIERYTFDFIALHAAVIVATWVAMVLAVLLDLWTGVEKAKALGEPVESRSLRRTVAKIGDYWRMQAFALMFDIFASLWLSMPFASMLCALGIMLIEAKSVFENLRAKRSPAAKLPKVIAMILRARSEKDAEAVLKMVEEEQKKNKDGHNDIL